MLEYIETMRQLIGKAPLMLPCATVAYIRDGMILLQKRLDNKTWSLHGGAMDLGESPEDTAKREFLEETGLTAVSLKLWNVYAGEKHHYTYPNGDEVFVVDIVYICEEVSGTLCPQASEVSELKWFSLKKLPEHIFPLDYEIIVDLVNDIGNC